MHSSPLLRNQKPEVDLSRWPVIVILAATLLLGVPPRETRAATAPHAMVAAEGDLAAHAGLDVLARGGNAVDAAVAIALVLGVTNSGSCGIGGGGFMLIYRAREHKVYALDYREVAPQAASPTMYEREGKIDEKLAQTGALAVAVPGELAGLDVALKRFGSMKFAVLAAPAIKLAREGYTLSPHMARDVTIAQEQLKQDPGFRAVFFRPDGSPLATGDTVHHPNLARLIEALGDAPRDNFYHGHIAEQIAAYLKAQGGLLTAADLAAYQPVWREPLHLGYRGYEMYTMPPPSSGGVVLEMLGMLAPGHLGGLGFESPAYLAQLIEVMRQGFVDRDQYADPAFVKVPVAQLLSPEHIAEARRLALHHQEAAQVTVAHDHGTSNFCVVDRAGNVVDVTSTINTIFGAKIMDAEIGLILNDEMDDFAVAPGVPNAFKLIQAKANSIAPGKRPLSSMAPLIAMRDGWPAMIVGGSGGPTIITGVTQVTVEALDLRMDAAGAVGAPRIHEQAQPPTVFVEKSLPATAAASLVKMGYPIKVIPELGAVSAIRIGPGQLDGAFDPRKGGAAIGN
jgi:gamma-glutamyltranspeptidase / glutathione hydrolase